MRLLAVLLAGCGASQLAQPEPAPPSPPAATPVSPPAEPVQPAPISRTRVQAFETDLSYACLLSDTHRVACWTYQESPLQPAWVANVPASDALHVGGESACARGEADHVLRCWGLDGAGQLGRGRSDRGVERGPFHGAEPVLGADLQPLAVEDFVVGSSHACARSTRGDVSCWGGSASGETGAPPRHDKLGLLAQPVPRVVFRGATRLFGGDSTTCAVDAKEQLWCWGGQDAGYSGHGDTWKPRLFPTASPVRAMSFGSGHSCLLDEAGAISCRGWNPGGQLGSAGHAQAPMDGKGARHTDFRADFARVPELAGRYVSLSATRSETCGVTESGTLECVGTGDWPGAPTLGPGPRTRRAPAVGKGSGTSSVRESETQGPVVPVKPIEGFTNVVAVRGTMGFRCALDREGDVSCVGSVHGYGSREPPARTPVLLPLPR